MRTTLAVAAGAAIGASARWGVGEAMSADGFPWATLIVNVLGCALIGWCAMRLRRGTVAWCFVVTGCLGGFTTASAFALDTRHLLDQGRTTVAVLYVVVSVVGGLAAAASTRRLAEGPAA